MKSKRNIYIVACFVFVLDQVIKFFIRQRMELFQEIPILPNFFSLYYVENTGAAFSIFRDSTVFLILVSVLFLVFFQRYLKKESSFSTVEVLSYGMILGGICGNLMDRICFRVVTDYLSFVLFSYSFPVFNLADIGITVGVFLTIIDMFWKKRGDDDDEGDLVRNLKGSKRGKSRD